MTVTGVTTAGASAGSASLAYVGPVSFMRSRMATVEASAGARFAVLGVPSDEGSTWQPGCRFGPRRMREVSMRFARPGSPAPGFWNIDQRDERVLDEVVAAGGVVDVGDVEIFPTMPAETWANVTEAVRRLLAAEVVPVVLGGDHAITYPVLRAFDRDVTLVQFDAHMDYQDYASGYKFGHASPMRLIDDELRSVRRIVHAGIRAFRTVQQEVDDSLARGNAVLSVRDLRSGPGWLDEIPTGSAVYLTLDMDVLDPPLVPGVNAPEPDGLQFGEMCEYIRRVADRHEIIGVDVAEVNPTLDSANQLTAFLAVQLLVFVMGQIIRSQALHAAPKR